MLTYVYTARDPNGGDIKAEVQADSEQSAAKLIRNQGLTPVSITIKGERNKLIPSRHKVKAKDKVLFSRQLSTLVGAGLPITQSLRTVAEQTPSKEMNIVINRIVADVEAGKALAKAFEAHPEVFNSVFVNLVAAGETSGTLDEALERLARGEYGWCVETGEPIGLKRLLLRPTASLCIEAKERQEQREKHLRHAEF